MTQDTPEEEPVDLRVTYTDIDLVKLEFFQGRERLLWVDLARETARDWAGLILKAAGMRHKPD